MAIIGRALENPSHRVSFAAQRVWWKNQEDEMAAVFLPTAAKLPSEYYIPVPADRIDLAARYMPNSPRLSVEGRTGERIDGLSLLPQIPSWVHLRNRPGHAWHGIDLAPLGIPEGPIRVDIYQNAYATSLAPLERSPVKTLALSHPNRTGDLEALTDFTHLTKVEFNDTLPVQPLNEILPTSLKQLSFISLQIKNLAPLEKVPGRITGLLTSMCRDLTSLQGVESQGESLISLCIRTWINHVLPNLAPLRELPRLTRLRVDLPTAERNIDHIIHLPELRYLFLELSNRSRQDLSWIRSIPKLENLYITHAGTFDLASLAGVRGLTVHVRKGRKAVGVETLGEGSSLVRDFPQDAMNW